MYIQATRSGAHRHVPAGLRLVTPELGIDTEGVIRRMTRFGFPAEDWKPFRMYDGAEVLVPGQFNVTIDERGDTLMHPLGDRGNPPSARMPNGGYFFDAIIRQQPFFGTREK